MRERGATAREEPRPRELEKAGTSNEARASGPTVEGEEGDLSPLSEKGLAKSPSVTGFAWQADRSPESPGREVSQRTDRLWPDRREPTLETSKVGSRGASRTDATSRRGLRGNPVDDAVHSAPRRVHAVIRRLQVPSTRHRARRFCERGARRRPRSQGGRAPAAPEPSRRRCRGRGESVQDEPDLPATVRSGGKGRPEPGAWHARSPSPKQGRRSGGSTARGDARASCAPTEIGESDLER